MGCEITKQRFNRANNVGVEFSFTTTDFSSSKVLNNNNDEGQEREDVAMAYDISPDRHKRSEKGDVIIQYQLWHSTPTD